VGALRIDEGQPGDGGTPARRNLGSESLSRPHEYLTEALEANGQELIGAAVEAAKNGDWRALMALMDRVYGRPTEHLEQTIKTPRTIEEIRAMTSAQRQALLYKLEAGGSFDEALLMIRNSAPVGEAWPAVTFRPGERTFEMSTTLRVAARPDGPVGESVSWVRAGGGQGSRRSWQAERVPGRGNPRTRQPQV
jgi:hypothetical protein